MKFFWIFCDFVRVNLLCDFVNSERVNKYSVLLYLTFKFAFKNKKVFFNAGDHLVFFCF